MASTYVNDLRLNELATGDASGTWGTITNTNLELIAEALVLAPKASQLTPIRTRLPSLMVLPIQCVVCTLNTQEP